MNKTAIAIGVGIGATAIGVASASLYRFGWKAPINMGKLTSDPKTRVEKQFDDYSEALRKVTTANKAPIRKKDA